MKRTASVAELKARLSEHLRLVKAGHEIVVTERGLPVARLLPLDDGERRSTRRLRLTRNGTLKPGRGKLPPALKRPPAGEPLDTSVVEALIEERRDDASDR
jgi:prevent-host-death family protein